MKKSNEFFRFFFALRFVMLVCAPAFIFPEFLFSADTYSITGLREYPYKKSPIYIETLKVNNSQWYSYNVRYTSMGLNVSARLSLPAIPAEKIKGMVIMLRGHYFQTSYYTGRGTEMPAKAYLRRGWAVIAPDFFGYAGSSPTPSPAELHQFYSTVNAIELYKSLEEPDFRFGPGIAEKDRIELPSSFKKFALWGHSNGGQVALHFLEVTGLPLPSVLWGPVCIPFPDSWIHYRGAPGNMRERYGADYSLIAQLPLVAAGTRILLDWGSRDSSVPKSWCDSFAAAVEAENRRRDGNGSGKIVLDYRIYPGADHSLLPLWEKVQDADASFWE